LYATPDYGRGSFESESEATRLRLVRHLVDRDRDRENRHVILARRDFHRVRVCNPQPLLRDLRDPLSTALHGVAVVGDVPLDLDVCAAGDIGGEALAKWRDEGLLDGDITHALALNVH